MQIYLKKGLFSLEQREGRTATWSLLINGASDGRPVCVLGEIVLKHTPEFHSNGDLGFRLDDEPRFGATTADFLEFVGKCMKVIRKCDEIERNDGVIILTPVKKCVDTRV